VTIASSDADAAARAVAMVKWLTEDAEIGKIYVGTVKKVVDFGAFVEILPGTEGLVHISQLAKERVNKVTDILQEGDEVVVKVLEIDKQGKIRLSRKKRWCHCTERRSSITESGSFSEEIDHVGPSPSESGCNAVPA